MTDIKDAIRMMRKLVLYGVTNFVVDDALYELLCAEGKRNSDVLERCGHKVERLTESMTFRGNRLFKSSDLEEAGVKLR